MGIAIRRAWRLARGLLYASEHGPSTDDEPNLIVAEELRLARRRRFQRRSRLRLRQLVGVRVMPCRTLKFDNLHPPVGPAAEGVRLDARRLAPPSPRLSPVPAG